MTLLFFDHSADSNLTLSGLCAWLLKKSAGLKRKARGDAPTRYTDAEIRDLYYWNRGHSPVATDAMTQHALRAGLWGRYF